MSGFTANLDSLSPAAREVLRINVSDAYTRLVVDANGNREAREKLAKMGARDIFAKPGSGGDEATAILAGLWLWHDWLEQSHKLAQSLQTDSGSFWHAIMHRREGDFSNSKYWYARCASHPILTALATAAGDAINPFPADKSVVKIAHRGWDADAFVDLVEAVHDHPGDPRHNLAVALQQLEWRMLFDYCMRAAGGQ
jgi:hypothetical protein